MHVISHKPLLAFAAVHPDADKPLDAWYRLVKKAQWANFADVRREYPSADQVGSVTVFNIGGNKYRLIAVVMYEVGRVYVRAVLTHKDYDRGQWKADKPKPKGKGPKQPKEES
jgi:mRNA interferase HigB